MSGEKYDAPLVQEYLSRLDKEIAPLEQDLLTGRNISTHEQYVTKVKTRAAFIRSKAVMRDLINEARKGEKEL